MTACAVATAGSSALCSSSRRRSTTSTGRSSRCSSRSSTSELSGRTRSSAWSTRCSRSPTRVGLLLFGAFVDRVGTKIGYARLDRGLEPGRHWPRAGRQRGRLLRRAGRAGARRGRQLPVGHQGRRALVPQARARVRDRASSTPAPTSAPIVAPAIVPRIAAAWGWQCGVRRRRHRRVHLAAALVAVLRHAREGQGALGRASSRTSAATPRRAGATQSGTARGLALVLSYRADLVVHRRQVPDRPGLVVLPHLAARLLQEDARARHQEELGPPRDDLRRSSRCSASWAAGWPAT